jgi:hypothetical protein
MNTIYGPRRPVAPLQAPVSRTRRRRQRILGPWDSRVPERRSAHGLSVRDQDAMLARQGGLCAICRRPGQLQIDHDHRHCPGSTGCRICVRGMICARCNSGLGLIEDANVPNLLKYLGR